MFCPQCGSTQSDDLKFCKTCGANLQALRQVMASRESDEKFDWSKTWVAEMFQSSDVAARRAVELDVLMGKTPEERRRNEIKAGVITASVGIGITLLLLVLMGGIIAGGRVSDAAAEILSRLWIVGILPVMIGAALVVNGVFISKRKGESGGSESLDIDPSSQGETRRLHDATAGGYLSPVDTSELFESPLSVTDATTQHLRQPVRAKARPSDDDRS